MKFYLPKREDKEAFSNLGEYARRTELITKMVLAGWLTEQGELWTEIIVLIKNPLVLRQGDFLSGD